MSASLQGKFIKKFYIVVSSINSIQGFSSLYRSIWGELEYLIKVVPKVHPTVAYEEK
jgi:hypothetical protein